MGEWLPIESAPRDGTPFLAYIAVTYRKGGPSHGEMAVIWCDDETGEINTDCYVGWDVDDYSHWMPLPTPPEPQP